MFRVRVSDFTLINNFIILKSKNIKYIILKSKNINKIIILKLIKIFNIYSLPKKGIEPLFYHHEGYVLPLNYFS